MPKDLQYLVHRIAPQAGAVRLEDPLWQRADELLISNFHAKSSNHHPRTRARVLHDGKTLFLRFDVEDHYVLARSTHFQDMVCFDSCVEFFFRPVPTKGYFNLEINCGGIFLCYFVEDSRWTEKGLAKFTQLTTDDVRGMSIEHTMPKTVFPERTEPTHWSISCAFPVAMLERYVGPLGDLSIGFWDGNFYKCADHTSHPHWGSWAPLGEQLNFHSPAHFKPIHFEK